MQLNIFYPGPQAWFFLAEKRGCLAKEGAEVKFMDGDAGTNIPPKIATGDFDSVTGFFLTPPDGHTAT